MFRRLLTNSFRSVQQQQREMKIVVDKVLADNYMYYIVDEPTKEAYVVDLGDASRLADIEKREDFELKAALITHHHWDHSAGCADFAKEKPNAAIYGQDKARIPNLTTEVSDEQVIQWNERIQIECFSTPGHTTSHTCYYVTDTSSDQKALFTGDTLFLAGAGKFFECKPRVMHTSLSRLLEKIDDSSEMYFGHEYSVNNLKFALKVEPQNKHISEKLDQCRQLLEAGKPTCPSKFSDEKLYNPFLRFNEPSVQKFAGVTDPVEVLEKIREEKNNFKA